MPYLILIDRSTIRPNPDYCPPGMRRMVPGPVIAHPDGSFGREAIDVTSLHSPRHLYSYQPQDVTCGECGATFDHSLLKSNEFDDSGSRTTCPKCGEPWCCEVEYERL